MRRTRLSRKGYSFDAFGSGLYSAGSLPGSGPNFEEFGYGGSSGYETEPDTGLIRCGNRYYNPYFGRFITQDHAKSGMNWYAYCGNDPTGRTYRSGTVWQTLNGGSANINRPTIGDPYAVWVDDSTGTQQYTVKQNPNGSIEKDDMAGNALGTYYDSTTDIGKDDQGNEIISDNWTFRDAEGNTSTWNGEEWVSDAATGMSISNDFTEFGRVSMDSGAVTVWYGVTTGPGAAIAAPIGAGLAGVGGLSDLLGWATGSVSQAVGQFINGINNSPPAIYVENNP